MTVGGMWEYDSDFSSGAAKELPSLALASVSVSI